MDENLVNRLRSLAGMLPQKHTLPSGADTVICSLEAFMQIKELAEEAANALEELSKPRWIPVTERLPGKPENYPHCELRKCYFLVTLESTAVVSCGYDFENNRWRESFKVTHWMPLPEPPKEET